MYQKNYNNEEIIKNTDMSLMPINRLSKNENNNNNNNNNEIGDAALIPIKHYIK